MRSPSAVNFSDKVRLKLPRKKLYRTNSIARELRTLGKPFEWFTKNSIKIDLPVANNLERKRTIFITGSLSCYKVRVDVWSYVSGGDFTYREYAELTGRSLLYRLVAEGTLNDTFLPCLPPYCQALIEKL